MNFFVDIAENGPFKIAPSAEQATSSIRRCLQDSLLDTQHVAPRPDRLGHCWSFFLNSFFHFVPFSGWLRIWLRGGQH